MRARSAEEDEVDDVSSEEQSPLEFSLFKENRLREEEGQQRLLKAKGQDRQQLCVELLLAGCVQSFVDFFYITHRKAPEEALGTLGEAEAIGGDVEIPEDAMAYLKETLEGAESARRSRSQQRAFEGYNELGEYFERAPDLPSATYFYRRCVEVAQESEAHESVAQALLSLGGCEEQQKNWHGAMEFQERALALASSSGCLPLQTRAACRITEACQTLATPLEREGKDAEAAKLLERGLACAQLSGDSALEGGACHRLGLSKHKTGHYERALELQKRYLEICRTGDDRAGEAAARAALAQGYEATDRPHEAIKQLEGLLTVAGEAGELRAQANACLNLGILYSGRGDHEKSVELLEQHFDLARQIGDRRLVDSARVVLGMVRGSGKLKSYIELVNHDLDRLLRWKSKRALDP